MEQIHKSPPLFSEIDESIDKTQPFIMGIDEAGRGPVLGPLVYGSCFAPLSQVDTIKKMKFNDSKKLTDKQREALFIKILNNNKILGFVSDINEPSFLSQNMLLKSPISLDILSHESAFRMIRAVLDKGINVQELYLDTVGPPVKYQSKLMAAFPSIGKIVVSKKADSIYPIVSASSICAKVLRDILIANTSFDKYDLFDDNGDPVLDSNFGSGYPGDPATKKWLLEKRDKIFGYPDNIIRFSWKTTTNNMQGECYGVDWNPPTPFSYTIQQSTKRKRSTYFENNNLDQTLDF